MKNKPRLKQLLKLHHKVVKKEKHFLGIKPIWEKNNPLRYWTKLDHYLKTKLIELR